MHKGRMNNSVKTSIQLKVFDNAMMRRWVRSINNSVMPEVTYSKHFSHGIYFCHITYPPCMLTTIDETYQHEANSIEYVQWRPSRIIFDGNWIAGILVWAFNPIVFLVLICGWTICFSPIIKCHRLHFKPNLFF